MGATLYPENNSGSQGDQAKGGIVTETASWNLKAVIDSAATDTELTVRAALVAAGYIYGSAHPVLGNGYRLRSQAIDRNSPLVFTVKLGYKTPEFDPNNPTDQPPWLKRATINFGSVTTDEPIDEDINGNAIQTAAEEPIQGLTRPISDLVIKLKRAFQSFSAPAFYLYADSVNSDTFLGFPPGTLKASAPSASENEWEGFIYYDVEMDILARKPYRVTDDKAWHKRVKHSGYRFKIPIAGTVADLPSPTPVNLTSTGQILPVGQLPEFLTFEIFESVAFSGMGWF